MSVLEGLRVRVLVLRERVMANFRISQDAEGPPQGTVEGFVDRQKVSMQKKLGNNEIDMVRISRTREIHSGTEPRAAVIAFAFAWCEELHVLQGSEFSKGD